MLQDLPLSPHWRHQHLEETDSTMLYLKREEWTKVPEEFVLLTADYQTAGRGQRGTSWEASRADNLLFGIRLHPTFLSPQQSFFLSEVQALAVAEALEPLVADVTLKWPNDVYVGERKICGMLLEHTLRGTTLADTLTGVGLNVNQQQFLGDAPNPVSIYQLLGHEVDRAALLTDIVQHFEARYRQLQRGETVALHNAYLSRLYRREGFHPFDVPSGGRIEAAIAAVLPDGRLVLRRRDGAQQAYAFKEVSFVLSPSRR